MGSDAKKGYRKGLGNLGAMLLSRLSAAGKNVFNSKEASFITGKKHNTKKLLYDLTNNNWIKRIERGKYVILPLESGWKVEFGTHPFLIARKLVAPYYVSFLSALN
jgi:predicted transcriptional regulator of viral defense system